MYGQNIYGLFRGAGADYPGSLNEQRAIKSQIFLYHDVGALPAFFFGPCESFLLMVASLVNVSCWYIIFIYD